LRKPLGEEAFAALAAQFVGAADAVSASPGVEREFPRAKAGQSPIIPPVSAWRISSALEPPVDTMLVDLQPRVSLSRSDFPVVTTWQINPATIALWIKGVLKPPPLHF